MKIIQIIPCQNVWIRIKNEDGSYRYIRAECLGLLEDVHKNTGIQYLFLNSKGLFDSSEINQDGLVYTDRDLSDSTGFWDK